MNDEFTSTSAFEFYNAQNNKLKHSPEKKKKIKKNKLKKSENVPTNDLKNQNNIVKTKNTKISPDNTKKNKLKQKLKPNKDVTNDQKITVNGNGKFENHEANESIESLESKNKKQKSPKKKKDRSPGDTENKNENQTDPQTNKKIQKLLKLQSKLLLKDDDNSEGDFLPKKTKKRKSFQMTSPDTEHDGIVASDSKKCKVNFNSSNEELEISKAAGNFTDNEYTSVEQSDSVKTGEDLFKWIIAPVNADTFFKESWEKRPLHIKRFAANYYQSLLTTGKIDKILRDNNLHFGRNIDITDYKNGVRETLNPDGRAMPAIVWDYYSNGCSVRMLNPQSYSHQLHRIISYLQEFFGTFVGANAYLTPPDSQGFAPHYDDIEAFILQVEGKKHWKLYSPRNPQEILPRYSSPNFKEEDMPEPSLEVTLEAGDLLYFPRGTIHQGKTVEDAHSLHITLSFYQKTSWIDFLEKLLPEALKIISDSDPEFRQGLPLHFTNYMGMVNYDKDLPERKDFCKKLEQLLCKLFKKAPIDSVVDQFAKQFQYDAMPPVLRKEEKAVSSHGDGDKMLNGGQVVNRVEIDVDTKVKLLRKNILRLVMEDDTVRIYHYAYNGKVYHEEEPQFFEIDRTLAAGVEMLIHRYPAFTKVSDLPIEYEPNRLQVISDLWERGLLLTDKPLPTFE